MEELFDKIKNMVPDTYDWYARIYPMLILLFPILLTFWAIVPENMYEGKVIASLAVWCGAGILCKELGRDRGKSKEKQLWKSWGGAPSTAYLRYRGTTNKATLAKIHGNLKMLFPDIENATPEFEANHPDKADEIYEEYTRQLRNSTRDTRKYKLLFNENCSYGFWRNLWGLKEWGIGISALCLVIILGCIVYDFKHAQRLGSYNPVICGFIDLAVLVFWLALNENRIKIPAYAYAERLFEATDQLRAEMNAK
jgi:hypothetical protein